MATFRVEGGHRLKGELVPQGAKNEALQILSAVLLTSEEVIVENVPDILDVNKLIELLADLGVKVEHFVCLFALVDVFIIQGQFLDASP